MKIVSVNIRRKHLVGLELDPEPDIEGAPRDAAGHIAIDLDLCLDLDLKEGMELGVERLLEILSESEYRRAKSRAMWYVSVKDCCRAEIAKKLSKDFSEEAISRALDHLEERGIIDDRAYAEKLARRLIEDKGVAPKVAPYLMAEKGLDKNLSKEVVAARADDPRIYIKEIIERKYSVALETEKGRDKTIAALMRKGYSYGDIKAVLSEFPKDSIMFGD